MRKKAKVHRTWLLLAMIVLWHILASCSPQGLPKEGRAALDQRIAKLAGAGIDYKIVSIQKAPGAPEERRVGPELPSNSGVSGCPPDLGDREAWCVVLGQEITDKAGHSYSHFLLRRVGNSWYVEELAEVDRFAYVGCSNWDATR